MGAWQTDAGVVSSGSLIGLDTENASPPTNAYIGVNDQLQVYVASSLNPAYVRVYARILLPDGKIVPNDWTITSLYGRGGNVFPQQLAEGFLLSLTVYDSNATDAGQTYVRVSLQRSGTVNYTVAQVLLAGYVYTNNLLSWPSSPLWPKLFGRGHMRAVVGTVPAPGQEISEQVPGNTQWRLVSFIFALNTSATVATRGIVLMFDDGTNIYSALSVQINQPGTQIVSYTLGSGYGFSSVDATRIALPLLTDHYINSGFRIRTVSSNLQAADQYFNVAYLVEEWLA